jgi:3-oxoacyl-[acyl-carrier-protein] synthase II
VAITGLGFVTPLGHDAETIWSNLVEGVSGIGPITQFDASGLATQIAGEVKNFVPEDYMEGKDARNAARYAQFAQAAAAMGVADAGLQPGEIKTQEIGVIISSCYGGILDLIRAEADWREKGAERISPFAAPMVSTNIAAAFVAMNMRAGGVNFGISSACASGASAIGEAGEVIRRGDAKVMIAGGAEACITPPLIATFNRLRATSQRNDDPTHACRPFDVDRDGFIWSEGSVVLILENWDHAQKRGARIHAELVGYGTSMDMYSFTKPDPEGTGAARSIQMAVGKAGLEMEDVDYVNAHGTSTRLGDVAETNALKKAFGDHARRLPVSSTKSLHGHLIGAAGAIETAICVLALERQVAPPTMNLDNQDPECDLDYVPNHPRRTDIDVAMSNSFGFGGHNATIVVARAK